MKMEYTFNTSTGKMKLQTEYELWKAVRPFLTRAANKGATLCHSPTCNRRCCPRECECNKKAGAKLNFETAIVWTTAYELEKLRGEVDDYLEREEMNLDVKDDLTELKQRIYILKCIVSSFTDAIYLQGPEELSSFYLDVVLRYLRYISKALIDPEYRIYWMNSFKNYEKSMAGLPTSIRYTTKAKMLKDQERIGNHKFIHDYSALHF